MNFAKSFGGVAAAACLVAGIFGAQACSSPTKNNGFGASSGASGDIIDLSDGGGGDVELKCENLQCAKVKCTTANTDTTITGRVFDPSGKTPLYNVIVYVPNSPPPDLVPGAKCESCSALALNPVSVALTDEEGRFTLRNVPVVDDLPVVIQVGKWRRQLVVPKVASCAETKIADGTFRLPRNKAEGDMPQIALVTGGLDPLGCLLSRAGIDTAEFTNAGGKGRVHVFKGVDGEDVVGGGASNPQTALWDSKANLSKYDVVLLSCEGGENNQTKSDASKVAMRDYMNGGGRVFATHYHYTWFKNGPADIQSTATWGGDGYDNDGSFKIETSFPKGQAFAKWLKNVGASPDGLQIPLKGVTSNINATRGSSQQWITGTAAGPVKYMTLNLPVGVAPAEQCGRAVLSTLHVSGTNGGTGIMPTKCGNTPLTAQEKALLFLLFDLSACVSDDKVAPPLPK